MKWIGYILISLYALSMGGRLIYLFEKYPRIATYSQREDFADLIIGVIFLAWIFAK